MQQSAHRDVGLWKYERPSRGYAGYHLRARNASARQALRKRIAELQPDAAHRFKLADSMPEEGDRAWPRRMMRDIVLQISEAPVRDTCDLTLTEDARQALVAALEHVTWHEETSVSVADDKTTTSLWVWWDVA